MSPLEPANDAQRVQTFTPSFILTTSRSLSTTLVLSTVPTSQIACLSRRQSSIYSFFEICYAQCRITAQRRRPHALPGRSLRSPNTTQPA